MLLTKKQLKNYLNQMIKESQEQRRKLKDIADEDLRNAYEIYTNLNKPALNPEYNIAAQSRTSRTKGSISTNVFNNALILHEKSYTFFTSSKSSDYYGKSVTSTPISKCYPKDRSNQLINKIPPKNAAIINLIDEKIRENLSRPQSEEKWKSNVFGKTKKIQEQESHSFYMYRTGSIGSSKIIEAYNQLNLKDPAQVYHYVMDNCILSTGDDVELGIAHYFHLLTSLSAQHIDTTGTDINLGEYKIECKSTAKPNSIESGLHASFPEDDRKKFYVFISNRGSDNDTQICIINSKLLRFVLLFPDIEENSVHTENIAINNLNDYINKFGNKDTNNEANFNWIRSTVMTQSSNIIQNFINKTTTQFKNGNAEDFDDAVTFRIGNAKIMIRTQVKWGLSQIINDSSPDNSNISEIQEGKNKLYQKILLELLKNSEK